MGKWLMGLVCASICTISAAIGATGNTTGTTQEANPVTVWNKTLQTIVRTPGAQPKTVHAMRSFAVMHAAIYDAVNTIDRRHKAYLVAVSDISPRASQGAAATAARPVKVY